MFQQEELCREWQQINSQSLKFIRRKDLSNELRLEIIYTSFGNYGTITKIAKKHEVSRRFIYDLRNQLKMAMHLLWGSPKTKPSETAADDEQLALVKEILDFRLIGKCTISAINKLLKRKGFNNSSIGHISGLLTRIGKELGSTITTEKEITYALVYASDEVFSSGLPILITVDPVSSAILRIELAKDRKGATWKAHWQSLLDIGVIPIYLTSDEGTGMKAAIELMFPNLVHQTDTFHAVAYRLGKTLRILLEQVYATINEEYEQERLLQNAKSQGVKTKRTDKYACAKAKTKRFIKLYEDFSFWYEFMIEQFELFDNNGVLNDHDQAKNNMEFVIKEIELLDWLIEGKNKKIEKTMTTIKALVPNLFHFLNYAKEVVEPLLNKAVCPNERLAIQAICLAYQYRKNGIKIKNNNSKKHFILKEKEAFIIAQIHLEKTSLNFEELQKDVYKQLETIVQSSAMVETINSIVRTYFNSSKNQITQEHLNLIMFYHNHRRYTRGKRKGSTPMELLTGKEQKEDWLDLLLSKIQSSVWGGEKATKKAA